MGSTHRPLGVTIVGGLEFLLGLVILVVIISSAFVSGIINLNLNNTVATVIVGIIAGGIPLIIGYGMLKGWSIMWFIGVIFNIIAVIGGIISFPAGLLGTVIAAIILYYLFTKDVRRFFR